MLFDSIKTAAKITDSVLVGLSTGKDSIVTYDLCCRYFKRVHSFFMYLVPDLEFQELALRWYEKQYGNKILRVPHFETSEFYRYGSFRDPDGEVQIVSVREEYNYLRYKTGTYWIAGGERVSDSIVRRAMIKHSGSIDEKRGRFYPLAEWVKKDVIQYIDHYHLFLSPEQKDLGFSFASLAGSELSVIKQYYPDDYDRILHYFPEADAGVERFERYGE